ncbi:sensor histidine kinase [Paenibacillus sp. GP183]|uniref:cache domain-containing sensor histidine kinase n=1 Tax=Paenibacillus sp. GP183 TaxID=1882751 RepID=UPI000895D516|nr:sensor histidine kinase [Paenibacillus sp. GP183]SEC02300.1 two-component system, sensor histidine kinase YesM [Paenibacillus sp. GP183]
MRRFAFTKIQSSIAAAFFWLILFTTLIMSLISYNLSVDDLTKKSQDSTIQIIDQVNRNIKANIISMEYISLMALNNADIRAYMQAMSQQQVSSQEEYRIPIQNFFSSVLSSRKDIASLMLANNQGSFIVTDKLNGMLKSPLDVKRQTWFQGAKDAGGLLVISAPHVQNFYENEHRWVVSFSREIRSAGVGQSLGVFLIDMNFDVIHDICSDIRVGKRGYLFIVDQNGEVVYHPQQMILNSDYKTERIKQVLDKDEGSFATDEGRDSRLYTIKNTGFGWKIIGVNYLDELASNKEKMKFSFLFWGSICMVVGLVLAIVISYRLSRPIKRLESYMKEIEQGNFDVRSDITESNEIGKLSKRFNLMTRKIKELMNQIVVEQEIKRKSEMRALQAQINPHFLYNSLDSIVWMAERKKSEEVVLMTVALGNLLRASIGKGSELIPIREELEHITHYLTIQKMRYKAKLDFQIEVDEDILTKKSLKLILQPLVENCIYHGIKNKSGTGLIRITGSKLEGCIVLKVQDNGVGMDAERINRILAGDAMQRDKPANKGVGLSNVHERLRIYFGEPYGLTFKSEMDRGTEVSICYPILE